MSIAKHMRPRPGSLLEIGGGLLLSLAIIFGASYLTRGTAAAGSGIFVVSVEGTVEPGLTAYVRRGLEEAAQAKARAVLVEVDTPGGLIDDMHKIAGVMRSAEIPVHTYVKGWAASAGALIALSGQQIVMSPGAAMGAAEPITEDGRRASEKVVSFTRALFRSAAEARRQNGHPRLRPEIAEGMVDRDMAIPGFKERGKLVSLSADQALRLGYCDHLADNRRAALAVLGLQHLRVREFKPVPGERLVRFLTNPVVSSWLLVLGFLGLVIEAFTPGWGLAGSLGVASLGAFFAARILLGLAGLEVIFFFLVGLVLLVLEVFITPGFGLLGVLGLAAVGGSVVMSYGNTAQALVSLSGSISVTLLMSFILLRYLDRRGVFGQLLLNTAQPREEGYSAAAPQLNRLVGRSGSSLTVLRPAGVADLDGERIDVISEGGFLPAGTPVKVVKVEGNRVVVREVQSEGRP